MHGRLGRYRPFDGDGMINQKIAGEPYHYICSVTDEAEHFGFGEHRFGSEAPFIPRADARSDDDGYLISFITDMKQDRSECIILDAQNLSAGPVCTIILPHRISSGTHACWASGEQIKE